MSFRDKCFHGVHLSHPCAKCESHPAPTPLPQSSESIVEELAAELSRTAGVPLSSVWVEPGDDAGAVGMFGAWIDDDLVGCGRSPLEAIADAIRTARTWA